jgi:hypothetical protein
MNILKEAAPLILVFGLFAMVFIIARIRSEADEIQNSSYNSRFAGGEAGTRQSATRFERNSDWSQYPMQDHDPPEDNLFIRGYDDDVRNHVQNLYTLMSQHYGEQSNQVTDELLALLLISRLNANRWQKQRTGVTGTHLALVFVMGTIGISFWAMFVA